MKYVVATGGVSPSSLEAIHLLEQAVQDELKFGASLTGGVSVIFIPDRGYQGYQAVVYPAATAAQD